MADEWWSSARTDDDGGSSACSTAPPALDQDPAESASTTSTTTAEFLRPSLHVDDAAAAPPSSFLLADDPLPHMDWTTQATYMGGRAAAAAAEARSGGFDALLQLHGDAGRHFLLGQQPGVDAPALYAADSQYYSGFGDAAATKTFSSQEFSGFFGPASTRNFGGVPAVPPPPPTTTTTKPLLLQALEQKAFKPHKEPTIQVQDACSSVTRRAGVPDSPAPAKKPRIPTPSPLPTFKVRKEKLGDRITALQQLVSPFGKTDTASVLHEAIEYIRFLHDQVASLSSPYLSCGRPVQQKLHQQQAKEGGEAAKEDLRSRGLCLVPVASTYYAVASETTPEFWNPNFGGTFR
ncbi:hypothetical protein BS78_09G192600 [Paspalum vaginatum]|nr:hypothetical protein BS78_09G192600 [Paspalum vaginatum]